MSRAIDELFIDVDGNCRATTKEQQAELAAQMQLVAIHQRHEELILNKPWMYQSERDECRQQVSPTTRKLNRRHERNDEHKRTAEEKKRKRQGVPHEMTGLLGSELDMINLR